FKSDSATASPDAFLLPLLFALLRIPFTLFELDFVAASPDALFLLPLPFALLRVSPALLEPPSEVASLDVFFVRVLRTDRALPSCFGLSSTLRWAAMTSS